MGSIFNWWFEVPSVCTCTQPVPLHLAACLLLWCWLQFVLPLSPNVLYLVAVIIGLLRPQRYWLCSRACCSYELALGGRRTASQPMFWAQQKSERWAINCWKRLIASLSLKARRDHYHHTVSSPRTSCKSCPFQIQLLFSTFSSVPKLPLMRNIREIAKKGKLTFTGSHWDCLILHSLFSSHYILNFGQSPHIL